MFWSDRVAGARRRDAAQEVSVNGGASLPDPIGSAPETAPPVLAAPRVEMRPEGWRLVDRRGILKAAGMAAAAAPAAALLAACGGGSGGGEARKVRIGMVSPRTGALRSYADVDSHVVESMNTIFADGTRVGRNTLPVEIFVRDGQSDRNRAAAAAADLIFVDNVDIVLVGGGADNVNPVSDVCEAQGVPCLSTSVPWEAWFYSRGGKAETPFSWTYHVYWGMAELRGAYRAMWRALDVPHSVALLLPNNQEGEAFNNAAYGLSKLTDDGFQIAGTHRYNVGDQSFGTFVDGIVSNKVSIIAGNPSITDFSAFWKLLNEKDYKPHIVTLSSTLLFPTDVEALGLAADGFTTEVGWSPKFQYRSYLTKRTAEELANEFDMGTWSQPLGFIHALFEIVAQALESVDSIDDRSAVAAAIAGVQASTIVGNVSFNNAPNTGIPKNVATVPLAGGKWTKQQSSSVPYALHVVEANGLTLAADADSTRMVDLQSINT
ncbi:branched-chain amino acid transport system substrate-binding protein [Parafrankia irregularis]|uniref:Branched-chain amino acid transport system substrate-binding protein n=1 Tax=Parafrankia irregularis TaxID=795642 RepID=A0A0S4QFE8_9ACTN|nr:MULTISPECIES: ABC transporter substrate-binding protein [Parafrankia]MBE3203002.1 ABC transporter substrate-binding protein [Parafrankia sp. CH37]CUU54363.1 branched-chain amino acid transport system substrate-binding protein [Parafrankia irregularis]